MQLPDEKGDGVLRMSRMRPASFVSVVAGLDQAVGAALVVVAALRKHLGQNEKIAVAEAAVECFHPHLGLAPWREPAAPAMPARAETYLKQSAGRLRRLLLQRVV